MHAARHFYASALLEDGVSIRAVADYLGHNDPGFTLRVYAHLMPSSEHRARAAVDRALDAANSPTRALNVPQGGR
jgi:integrase